MGINVLSLFDGISCGRLALQRANIKVYNYYASEIDENAINITNSNFPDTIQLGDITNWRNWNIPWDKIDLLIGGSPCQGFSFAGKQLNFEDPRSKLFFEFVDILNHIKKHNPNIKFLLENVKMKKEYIKVFNEKLGVTPIEINSDLLSAQRRKRLYWTNIDGVTIPKDKNISISHVIDNSLPDDISFEELYKKQPREKWYYVGKKLKEFYKKHKSIPIFFSPYNCQEMKEKSVTLTTNCGQLTTTAAIIIVSETGVRNITLNELEKLQTLPVDYTKGVSRTARQKAIGNGWTVDVIAHILSFL